MIPGRLSEGFFLGDFSSEKSGVALAASGEYEGVGWGGYLNGLIVKFFTPLEVSCYNTYFVKLAVPSYSLLSHVIVITDLIVC